MAVRGIQSLQSLQMKGNVERQENAREKVADSVEKHQDHVDESYKQALIEVEKNREAREAKGFGALFGTLFLGPIIGTLIGDAIGGWVNDGDEAAARDAKKKWGAEDLQVQKAQDHFDEAKKDLEQASSDGQQLNKFSRELRDTAWVGTT